MITAFEILLSRELPTTCFVLIQKLGGEIVLIEQPMERAG